MFNEEEDNDTITMDVDTQKIMITKNIEKAIKT